MGTTLKDRALDIASSWFECLNSGDLERVLELYDSKATFHPTLSANFGRDEAATRSYFSEFLRKQPTATLRAYAIQRLSDNAFLISGTMHIQLDEDGSDSQIEARFTFAWQHFGGQWRIIHHHNSLCPP